MAVDAEGRSKGANLATIGQDESAVADQFSMLRQISSVLISIVDMDDLVPFIVQRTKELLDVEGASLLLHDSQAGELYFPVLAVDEEIATQLKGCRFPADRGIAGWVVREGKSVLVSDVKMDKRFYAEVDEITGFATKSVLCVPLHGKDDTLGVLEVVNKRGGVFSEADERLLEAMASNISFSIERSYLYQDLQRSEALLRRQNAELGQAIKQERLSKDIIGFSGQMMNVLKRARQVALTDSTVLICGETGTGKELLARAIHGISPRSLGHFVPINCAAIPENLLESMLFGHEKGAFTGAIARTVGCFEEASAGTLFLDEIADMPSNLQAKLLRVVEEGFVRPLGSAVDVRTDVRLIAATHQDLTRLMEQGRFRRDLYYRLRVFNIEIPPLRERKEDIPALVDHFITDYNERLGRRIEGIEDAALDILYSYDYPGNVRQLRHFVECAMIVSRGDMITICDLPKEILPAAASNRKLASSQETFSIPKNNEELKAAKAEARQEAGKEIERLFLMELLSKTCGNMSEAARQAGMNRSWLEQMIGRHRIEPSRFREVPAA